MTQRGKCTTIGPNANAVNNNAQGVDMRILRAGVFLWLFLFAATAMAGARAGVPIVNLENNPATGAGGKELTLEAIGASIKQAGASTAYPWTASNEAPGSMDLTTVVRSKHTVVVKVTYDTRVYNINLVSSINMNQQMNKKKKVEVIHPNYTVWVQELKTAIDLELAKH